MNAESGRGAKNKRGGERMNAEVERMSMRKKAKEERDEREYELTSILQPG